MALQILNLSIDTDYITNNYYSTPPVSGDYDDIDCFSELIIETIVGDTNYTSEDDDDTGHPMDKGVEKTNVDFVYFEQFAKPLVVYITKNTTSWVNGLDQANKTCKGYFKIICPPPKA